jgi:hypothetical protein
MRIRSFGNAFAVAAVVLAAGVLSSCAWLGGLFGLSIEHSWSGTLVDLYEDAEYVVTLDLVQDGDLVSGSATFAFDEETEYDVEVHGSRTGEGSFIVTLYAVADDDVTLTGALSGDGATFSGTWDLAYFENYGTFTLTRTD